MILNLKRTAGLLAAFLLMTAACAGAEGSGLKLDAPVMERIPGETVEEPSTPAPKGLETPEPTIPPPDPTPTLQPGVVTAPEDSDGEGLIPLPELLPLENGSLVTIPLDQDSTEIALPPREDHYLYREGEENPYGYVDPSIAVVLGTGRIYETNYMYARVRIADPSQLRAIMASPTNSKSTVPGHKLAARVQAVVAINGDYNGGDEIRSGALVRQGKVSRLNCHGDIDLLAVKKNGDLAILPQATDADVNAVLKDCMHIFTFGPALVVDGVAQEIPRIGRIGSHKEAQRMALCQTGPLEYLLITSEGPEDQNSVGLTIPQFTELIASFPEVQTAYNLDGGSSSTMVFRKNGKNWQKVNAPTNKKIRPLKDIVYFADAWDPDN